LASGEKLLAGGLGAFWHRQPPSDTVSLHYSSE
jgi:hypothetical protein